MQINWKLRLKNRVTLSALISAGALFANQVAALLGVDYSGEIKAVVDILGTILLILTIIGVLTDPTVKGVSDSDMSMMKPEPTSPEMDIVIEGDDEVTDESEVIVDNTNGPEPSHAEEVQ